VTAGVIRRTFFAQDQYAMKNIPIMILKAVISLIAVAALAARIVWPDLQIDGITFGLMVLAILPWLAELIESAKFPGGWEVKFRDLQKAGDKVTAGHESALPTPQETDSFDTIAKTDPNLALVMLRIEIEKRLRAYGSANGLDARMPLSRLTREVATRQVISSSTEHGLGELIAAGNDAAHGATVPGRVREWCINEGPKILAALDAQLQYKTDNKSVNASRR
jgi:hypothetical protein